MKMVLAAWSYGHFPKNAFDNSKSYTSYWDDLSILEPPQMLNIFNEDSTENLPHE